MVNSDRLSRLAQQLGERLQDASHAPEELQRGVHQAMRGAFDRLELVSREDFDILMDVLQRTRSRVEALEKQVAALEAALDTAQSSVEAPLGERRDDTSPPEDAGAGEASRPPGRSGD
ncbi:accessory factor UbiK family protein [Litchfieldella rifensis]|uniref:Ubiquinone biosynthesis accessory factor UbiK n=1 Tax=Litchfieldella rifensis TaxID=762643 RepID=A0ABV7LUS6_9GAMM